MNIFNKRFYSILLLLTFLGGLNGEDAESTTELLDTTEDSLPSLISETLAPPVSEKSSESPESVTDSVDNAVPSSNEDSNQQHASSRDDHNEQILELQAANTALASRIAILESKLGKMESMVNSVKRDVNFHHPTMELQYVDMQVLQWKEALRNGIRKMAIQFQAGYSLGAISTWEFSLANESDALTVNLLLVDEKYGKGALFAGFTAFVLDSDGNLYSQANALPVNFLDGNGRNLHLPNVIALDDIQNTSLGLLSDDDVFKIRFRLELLGVGHKLYSENPLAQELPSKDTQTVVFDVDDIFGKISRKFRESSDKKNDEDPLAYTRFSLKHDTWNQDTSWIAQLYIKETNEEGEILSLHILLDDYPWPELYASFQVEVWDFLGKRLIQTQGAPINNFAKDRISIEPLVILSQLKEIYDEDEVLSLRFKLQFIVYGQNARYYADVV